MQKEHIYLGEVDPGGKITVTVDDEHRLDLFLDVQPASDRMPALFSWGAGMPGGARLAFALLYHATKDNKASQRWSGKFQAEKLDLLDRNASWRMSASDIRQRVAFFASEHEVQKTFNMMRKGKP